MKQLITALGRGVLQKKISLPTSIEAVSYIPWEKIPPILETWRYHEYPVTYWRSIRGSPPKLQVGTELEINFKEELMSKIYLYKYISKGYLKHVPKWRGLEPRKLIYSLASQPFNRGEKWLSHPISLQKEANNVSSPTLKSIHLIQSWWPLLSSSVYWDKRICQIQGGTRIFVLFLKNWQKDGFIGHSQKVPDFMLCSIFVSYQSDQAKKWSNNAIF